MSDLVERLRCHSIGMPDTEELVNMTMERLEAADEIERLTTTLNAAEAFIKALDVHNPSSADWAEIDIAREEYEKSKRGQSDE